MKFHAVSCSLFFFVFVFDILFYVGTHLARGYSSGDPRNHYKHTHNTITSNHNNQVIIHTHCVVGGRTFFFKSFIIRNKLIKIIPQINVKLASHPQWHSWSVLRALAFHFRPYFENLHKTIHFLYFKRHFNDTFTLTVKCHVKVLIAKCLIYVNYAHRIKNVRKM